MQRQRKYPKRIDAVDEVVAAALRRKTPGERAMLAFEANRAVRAFVQGAIQTDHPDWTDQQVRREIARRMLGTDSTLPTGRQDH